MIRALEKILDKIYNIYNTLRNLRSVLYGYEKTLGIY